MSVSRRATAVPASPIRRLAPLAEAAARRGVRVLHLNIGQPDLPTPEPILRRLGEIRDPVLCYTPSGGTPQFLASIRSYYGSQGIEVSESQVLATTGGSEALLFAMMAVADPGDEIIVVEPFYTNYSAFAAMAGVRLVPVTSRGRDGFHLPPRELWERAITPRTRAVLLCNPSNPTGTVYRRDEVELVADFLRQPEGAFYFIARLSVDDSDDFAAFFLSEFSLDGERMVNDQSSMAFRGSRSAHL